MAKENPWRLRMRKHGITIRELCEVTGMDGSTFYKQFSTGRIPPYTKFAILTLEKMSDAEREELYAQLKAD